MKRALTVDLWDTLIYDLPEVDQARRDLRLTEIGKILYEACGFESEKSRGQMLTAYESSWQRLEAIWQTDQEIVPAEQLKMYLDILFENKVPNNLPEEKLLNAYLEPILDYLPFLMPAAKETLAWLKRRGWKLGLISNTGRTSGVYLRQVLQMHGVFQLFDTFTFSDEFGWRKPNPAIFERTLDRLDASSQKSFHLGDNWRADIQGAQKIGLNPLWFCRNGERAADPTVKQVKHWPELEFLLQG